jgi:hypothetical protein
MGDEVLGLCGPIRPEGMNKRECKFRHSAKQDTEEQVCVSSDRPAFSERRVRLAARFRIASGSTQ